MRKKIVLLFSLCFLCTLPASGYAAEKLPHVSPEMTQADYWVGQLSEPDRVLLSFRQIESLNKKFLRAEPTAVDPLTLEAGVSASFLLIVLEREESALRKKELFDSRGRKIGKPFWEDLRASCALQRLPDLLPVRFGLIVEECSLRTFPTTEPVVEKRGDLAFDLLQQTTLHPGTPVALLWESADGKWVYLVSKLLRGWAKKESIALFENREGLLRHLSFPKIVVTERKAPVFESRDEEPVSHWEMGAVLHTDLLLKEGDFFLIHRPQRRPDGKVLFAHAFLRRSDVQADFLPLTPRQILTQAFKLYGAPYGWGGLKGGWDCSSFLKDLFATMGVELPRNSGPQSRVGKILVHFSSNKGRERKKQEMLNQALPAVTFVKLDNHIMLYLGKQENRHYLLHATAGYGVKGLLLERRVRAFRVLVSDMEQGRGSKRGSLLQRMVSLNLPFDTSY